jgi:hypothetical protein
VIFFKKLQHYKEEVSRIFLFLNGLSGRKFLSCDVLGWPFKFESYEVR